MKEIKKETNIDAGEAILFDNILEMLLDGKLKIQDLVDDVRLINSN
jgi:hypothetical protein